jgi:citrate lyase beta subunit
MNNSFFDKDRNEKGDMWYNIVNNIMLLNSEAFFRAVFDAMQNHPTYVILSDFESDRKIYIMDQMLEHYEKKEDFEKCKVIFEIKKQIEIENRC